MSAVRGVPDLLPTAWRAHQHIIRVALRHAACAGYQEVGLPLLEHTSLYRRGVGPTPVAAAVAAADDELFPSQEMFTVADTTGGSLALRPEGTAGLVRMVTPTLRRAPLPQRFSYAGPMFRRERPQRGRFRQFYQFGTELFAPPHPLLDAEVMALGHAVLSDLGVAGAVRGGARCLQRAIDATDVIAQVTLRLNTLGDAESRAAYTALLADYFHGHRGELSPNSQTLLAKSNPLRILDSKVPADQLIVRECPALLDVATPAAVSYFRSVQDSLTALNVPFVADPHIVRGLGYYTSTVWEFVINTHTGAQSAVIAGGRYDTLVSDISPGSPVAAVGCAGGVERIALLMEDVCPENSTQMSPAFSVAIVRPPPASPLPACQTEPLGLDAALLACASLAHDLRSRDVAVAFDPNARKPLARQLGDHAKAGAALVVVVGDDELSAGAAQIVNLRTRERVTVSHGAAAAHIHAALAAMDPTTVATVL